MSKPTPGKAHAGLTIQCVNLSEAKPHPDNPRVHPPKGSAEWEALRKSLMDQYFDPLVWNRNNGFLVSGHYRRLILMDEGFQSADMVIVEWDDAKHKARMIAANTLSGQFDDDKFQALLSELKAGNIDQDLTGLTGDALDGLISGFTIPEGNKVIDEAALAQTESECPSCGFKW